MSESPDCPSPEVRPVICQSLLDLSDWVDLLGDNHHGGHKTSKSRSLEGHGKKEKSQLDQAGNKIYDPQDPQCEVSSTQGVHSKSFTKDKTQKISCLSDIISKDDKVLFPSSTTTNLSSDLSQKAMLGDKPPRLPNKSALQEKQLQLHDSNSTGTTKTSQDLVHTVLKSNGTTVRARKNNRHSWPDISVKLGQDVTSNCFPQEHFSYEISELTFKYYSSGDDDDGDDDDDEEEEMPVCPSPVPSPAPTNVSRSQDADNSLPTSSLSRVKPKSTTPTSEILSRNRPSSNSSSPLPRPSPPAKDPTPRSATSTPTPTLRKSPPRPPEPLPREIINSNSSPKPPSDATPMVTNSSKPLVAMDSKDKRLSLPEDAKQEPETKAAYQDAMVESTTQFKDALSSLKRRASTSPCPGSLKMKCKKMDAVVRINTTTDDMYKIAAEQGCFFNVVDKESRLGVCPCGRPNGYDAMIACDNPACQVEWYHFKCVGVTKVPKDDWYCPFCSKAAAKARKKKLEKKKKKEERKRKEREKEKQKGKEREKVRPSKRPKDELPSEGLCPCGQPNAWDRMIACDGKDCVIEWYHFKCVDITRPPDCEWLCMLCRDSTKESDAPFVRRRRRYRPPKFSIYSFDEEDKEGASTDTDSKDGIPVAKEDKEWNAAEEEEDSAHSSDSEDSFIDDGSSSEGDGDYVPKRESSGDGGRARAKRTARNKWREFLADDEEHGDDSDRDRYSSKRTRRKQCQKVDEDFDDGAEFDEDDDDDGSTSEESSSSEREEDSEAKTSQSNRSKRQIYSSEDENSKHSHPTKQNSNHPVGSDRPSSSVSSPPGEGTREDAAHKKTMTKNGVNDEEMRPIPNSRKDNEHSESSTISIIKKDSGDSETKSSTCSNLAKPKVTTSSSKSSQDVNGCPNCDQLQKQPSCQDTTDSSQSMKTSTCAKCHRPPQSGGGDSPRLLLPRIKVNAQQSKSPPNPGPELANQKTQSAPSGDGTTDAASATNTKQSGDGHSLRSTRHEIMPCMVCGMGYRTRVSLLIHMKNKHFGLLANFECVACDKLFITRQECQRHLSTFHHL